MALTYFRKRLSSSQREALYDRCRGENEFPTCNICNLPILIGQEWDASHDPDDAPNALKPREAEGVAHSRCNRLHGAQVVGPMVAKCDRVRRNHIGARVSRTPMPCGRNSARKRTMDGRVVERRPKLPRFAPLTDDDPLAGLTDKLMSGDIDEATFAHRASALGTSIEEIGDLIELARVNREMRA